MRSPVERYEEMVNELEITHQVLQEKVWILEVDGGYQWQQSRLRLILGGSLLFVLCVLLSVLLLGYPKLLSLVPPSSLAFIGSVTVMVMVLDVVWLYQVWNEHSAYRQQYEEKKVFSYELRYALQTVEGVLRETHWSDDPSSSDYGRSL